MTKLYIFNFSQEKNGTLYFSYLGKEEQKKAKVKKNQLIKEQYIYSRLLLRYAVSDNGFEYGNIIKNEKGKPYFKTLFPYFNISHSGNFVAVAISDKEVGVDIQKQRNISTAVFDKMFSEKEKEYIRNGEISASALWSIKESIFKYYGMGITFDINNKILFKDGNIKVENHDNLVIKIIFGEEYFLSVCSEEENIEFVFLDSKDLFRFYNA